MACHPSSITVDIVGLEASNNGRNFGKHEACGSVIAPDVVVLFNFVQLAREIVNMANPAMESTAIAVYHLTGGVDTCHGGFLRRHLLKYKEKYDGRLAHVTDIFHGESECPSNRAKYYCKNG